MQSCIIILILILPNFHWSSVIKKCNPWLEVFLLRRFVSVWEAKFPPKFILKPNFPICHENAPLCCDNGRHSLISHPCDLSHIACLIVNEYNHNLARDYPHKIYLLVVRQDGWGRDNSSTTQHINKKTTTQSLKIMGIIWLNSAKATHVPIEV